MRILRKSRFGSLCQSLLAVVALGTPVSAATVKSGWDYLEQNQHPQAQAAFQAALVRNPADIDALRGTAVVAKLEDREADALHAWSAFYHLAPTSWAAQAYWPEFSRLAEDNGRWDLLEGAAHTILAKSGTSASLQSSARLTLAEAVARHSPAGAGVSPADGLGYLRHWQIIGPFENASLSGFGNMYRPEQELAFASEVEGKDSQQIRWHRLSLVGLDGECAVGASLSDGDPDVYYAVTAIQSASDQKVIIQFDPTGSSKVFVNGENLFSDSVQRSRTELVTDVFAIPAVLHRGWNTILIKLGDDEHSTASFSLRLTKENGTPLIKFAEDPLQAQGGTKSSGSSQDAEMETTRMLRKQASTVETAALLGQTLRMSNDYAGSAEALRKGLALSPQCGWLHWELALTLEVDDQDDEGRSERSLALKYDPRLVDAALDAVKSDAGSATPPTLIARLRAILALNPHSPNVLWQLADTYDDAKLYDEAVKSARKASALSPGTSGCLSLVKFLDDQDKNSLGDAALTQALKGAPGDVNLLEAKADRLSDQQNVTGAIALYRRLLLLDPANPKFRLTLADLYNQSNQSNEAIVNLQIARQQCPQNSYSCAQLADCLHEQGKTKEALSLYTEAIRLDPSQLTLREKKAALVNQKPAIDLAPAADGAAILAAASQRSFPPQSSAAYLLDEARTVIYPDYASLIRYHQIIKILDQSAVEHYAQYHLARSTSTSQATVESARVIKKDGKIQDLTDSADENSVPFPSLAIGDTIDVTYRVEDYHRGSLAHEFWDQWSFNTPNAPSLYCRYVLITPVDMTYQIQNHGAVPSPVIKESGGWRIKEWIMKDIPPMPTELLGAGYTDSSLWIDVSTIKSWSEIVDWYEDLSRPRCIPDGVVRAKALELTKDATTEQDKIQALQGFVAREVQYQSSPFRLSAYVPTEGKKVINERYGDCKDKAALLTSMLAAIGIKCEMVLLSPRSHGLTPYLPSPRFNHAIARVETAQGPLWVDATADQLAFGSLPPQDQQVPALIIADHTSDLTVTPLLPADKDISAAVSTASLSDDGSLKGSYDWTLSGSQAWETRSVVSRVPESKQDELKQELAQYLIKDAQVDSGSWEQLAMPDSPLRFHFQYHVSHDGTAAGTFLLATLPWASVEDSQQVALLQKPGRTEDLDAISSRGHSKDTLLLTLPAGYLPQDLPATIQRQSPFGEYTITYKMQGTTLTATRDILLTATRVDAKDVPDYAAFLMSLVQETERKLVLKKS